MQSRRTTVQETSRRRALRAVAPAKASPHAATSAVALAKAGQLPCFHALAHSFLPSRKLALVFSCTYKLFWRLTERQLPRLQAFLHSFAETPGWGVPSQGNYCYHPSNP